MCHLQNWLSADIFERITETDDPWSCFVCDEKSLATLGTRRKRAKHLGKDLGWRWCTDCGLWYPTSVKMPQSKASLLAPPEVKERSIFTSGEDRIIPGYERRLENFFSGKQQDYAVVHVDHLITKVRGVNTLNVLHTHTLTLMRCTHTLAQNALHTHPHAK
jgi:hypothetical protein